MSILLTGGAGYIGTHTCVALLSAGYDVVVVDNYANSRPEALARVARITGKPVPAYAIDMCDAQALARVFSEHPIDAAIHFAGLKAVGESVAQPLRYYRNNLDATFTLLEAMARAGARKLVFSSSATVYGLPDEVPISERARTGDCSNPYGWTKYMIEQVLRDAAHAQSALSVMLLRYFNPVGAHESGLIGEDPNGIPNNLMPNVLRAAAGKVPMLRVNGNDYDTPDGTCVRDYIHVMDLAAGHVRALEYLAGHAGVEAVNLGTGVGYSVLEIIKTFERANNVKVPFDFAPRRPGDIACSYADPTKATELLHWRAERTLADMCRDAWRFQQHNPHGYGA